MLMEGGTTSGSFTVPVAYDEAASTVTLDHDADTFIRDVTWTVDGGELRGAFTSGSESISAALEWRL